MDIEIKLFSRYDRSQEVYLVSVGINCECFAMSRDVAVFSPWGGDVTVSFSGGSTSQHTSLPRTNKGKAALAQATTIFIPQLQKAIQGEFDMDEGLVNRLIVEKRFVVNGLRRDSLEVVGMEEEAYHEDGILEARIQHIFELTSTGGASIYCDGWRSAGGLYSIPRDVSSGVQVLASPELLDGKRLLKAKTWNDATRFTSAFYFTAADVKSSYKQLAVDAAELFAQVDLPWLFTVLTGVQTRDGKIINSESPRIVTRIVG